MVAPSLSIVTVTYNDGTRLEGTLQSILSQVDQSFEFIVIDGASTDHTSELVQNFRTKRPVNFVSEKDRGLYDAMNKGAQQATGDFILYLNAGDILSDSSSTHRLMLAVTSNKSVDAFYADVFVTDTTRGKRLKRAHQVEELHKGLPASHQALLLRRDHYKSFPFNCNLRLAADFDVGLRVYNAGLKEWVYLKDPFTTVSSGGLSDVRRYQARRECLEVLRRAGTHLQLFKGIIYQSRMMGLDALTTVARKFLGRTRYERLTARRWS